ncbi:MAG: hypothetical protein DI529_06475 [Chryseobacterium sp.]|nr:MAG: hypothetical protein DI529_06475 [Chryseobacterium sp.]
MKKYLILAAGFLATISYAQCTIAGNSTIKLNELASFSVDAKAQCDECYVWKTSSDKTLFPEGNTKSNKINVKANAVGKSSISVSILTQQGLLQCEKIVEITTENPASNLTNADNPCGIKIDDFKEIKVTDNIISFFPNDNPTYCLYQWTVTYNNGDKKDSSEKIPQFNLIQENPIISVKLKITTKSPICSYTITKKYAENHWKTNSLTHQKIEQRVYSPVSYSEYTKVPTDKTLNN